MVSKIFLTGQSFRETCSYLCMDQERAEVLAVEGVRAHDLRLMAEDFETQHLFEPEKEKPVFHGVLSFPHGEDPGDAKMIEIARKYLEEIEMPNTQYAMIKHTDKEHLHLHVLANRVNNEGVIIGQGLIIERGIKAARKLTQEYGLRPDTGKNLAATNLGRLSEADAKRYRLYKLIQDQLPGCRRVEDLEMRLMEKGVTTRYKVDEVSGKRVGISFRIGNRSFKGSYVDRACSLKKLEMNIAQQVELALKQQLEGERQQKLDMEARENLEKELKQKLENDGRRSLKAQPTLKQRDDFSEEQDLSITRSHTRGLRM